MLESIRNHAQGWMAKLILALITIPFALWGIDSYFSTGGRTESVAEVGDSSITRQVFSDAIKEQADRMRQAQGDNFDPAAVNTREFREQVLTRLTEEEAMLQEARVAGLQVPDSQLASVLQQLPPFQEEGKFSAERYKRVLAQRGYTPAYFEYRLRRDITLEIQQQPTIAGTMVSSTSVELAAKLAGQRREVSTSEISSSSLASQVTISDQEIENYYQAHKADFTDAEAVKVEYAILSLDDLYASISVTDKQVQDFFAANSSKFGPPEERTASHILIAAAESDVAARKQAKAKAELLLAAIRKAPDTFTEIARKESQDPGSAQEGGSLGSFGRGMMVKPFEDAVFSLKTGEISNLVETQFGYHIIRLDGIKSSTPVLSAVRAQVEEEVKRQQAQRLFADAAEQFSNLVYEQGASLKPAADALKLSLHKSDWMTRKGLTKSPFNTPKLVEAIFSGDAIKSRQNVEPIEIARNVMVAARVIDHHPARAKPVFEVSSVIRQKLLTEKIASLSENRGQAFLQQLKQGKEPGGLSWSEFKLVGRQQAGELDAKSLQAIMRADAASLPSYIGVSKPDGGYRIIRVTRIIDMPAADPALRSAVESGLLQTYARADAQAQVDLASSAHKVIIKQDLLDKKE